MTCFAGIAVFCLSALIASHAWAGMTLKEAYALEKQAEAGNKDSLTSLQSNADSGDVRAQLALAKVYGGGKNDELYMSWTKKASDAGYPTAEFELGMAYEKGTSTPKDDGEAMVWYRKAAEHGNALAMINIGEYYLNGVNIPIDAAQAGFWFTKAGDEGHAMTWMVLGLAYFDGKPIKKNNDKAIYFLEKSSDAGLATAQRYLSLLYMGYNELPKNPVQAVKWLTIADTDRQDESNSENKKKTTRTWPSSFTTEQVAEGNKLASEWLGTHAELNNYDALENP